MVELEYAKKMFKNYEQDMKILVPKAIVKFWKKTVGKILKKCFSADLVELENAEQKVVKMSKFLIEKVVQNYYSKWL